MNNPNLLDVAKNVIKPCPRGYRNYFQNMYVFFIVPNLSITLLFYSVSGDTVNYAQSQLFACEAGAKGERKLGHCPEETEWCDWQVASDLHSDEITEEKHNQG